MGMTGGLYRASEAEIQKLLDAPDTIEAFVESSTWAPPVREVRPKGMFGWLLKLTPVTIHETDPDAEPPPGYDPANDRPHCDLEGVWHALHFLFTGTAWEGDAPACYLISGGQDIGDPDELGYSSLHALGPDQTQRFAQFLNSLSREELTRRDDPKKMTALGIDGGWSDAESRALRFGHVLDGYEQLRAFVQATVDAKSGLIVYVT